jgi:hypothetical protein
VENANFQELVTFEKNKSKGDIVTIEEIENTYLV